MTGWNFQQIIDADTGRVLSNPTIFPCFGQAISKGYGMPCHCIALRDTTHVGRLHGHVRECICGLYANLHACP